LGYAQAGSESSRTSVNTDSDSTLIFDAGDNLGELLECAPNNGSCPCLDHSTAQLKHVNKIRPASHHIFDNGDNILSSLMCLIKAFRNERNGFFDGACLYGRTGTTSND
jgi:hypothetical protein